MTESKYLIRGYCGDTDRGFDSESEADTLKEARNRARYMLSEAYMRVVESEVPVVYAEVIEAKTGAIVDEFGTRV
jgi:hypothetical protein